MAFASGIRLQLLVTVARYQVQHCRLAMLVQGNYEHEPNGTAHASASKRS